MIFAATFIASTGDLSRFESPRLLMGYLGLVPSEHSSGGTIRRGGIVDGMSDSGCRASRRKTRSPELQRCSDRNSCGYPATCNVARPGRIRLSVLMVRISD